MTEALIGLLLNRRWILAILTVVIGTGVLWGTQYSSIDAGFRSILADDDPYKAEVDQAKLDFPPSTSVLFVFESNDDVFNRQALEAMDALTQRYTEIQSAIAIGSLLNRRLSPSDEITYGREYLFPELDGLSDADIGAIRQIALADEDLTKSILAPAGDMALAQVKYKANTDDQETRLAIARSVIELRDELREAFPGVDIFTLGNVMFELDSYQAQVDDRNLLFPLVIGLGIVLLWYCLRSLAYAITLFLVAFVTVGLAVGTFGWLNIPFNQISSLGPLVVLVIAIADGIHLVSVYAQGLHSGLERKTAMLESLRINLQPITLATVTTTMGFLSLNYTSSPGIYGFGNIVAIGVCWAYLVTLTLLPALVLALPTNKIPRPLGVSRYIESVDRAVSRYEGRLFWGGATLIVFTLALLPLNQLDFDRYSFIDEDSDFHRILTALREKIGNDQSLAFSIQSGEYYGITQPEFLNQVDRFSNWLDVQAEASFVTSYTDYLRARNKAEHDDDDSYDRLPEDQLIIIDYLVGYQLIQEIEPSLEPIFNSDYSAVRLVIGTSNLSNLQLIEFNDRIEAWIEGNFGDDVQVTHGDNNILFARLDRAITVELVQGFTVSFLLITLTMIVGLKSLRYGLLSIMPNLFPATIVFGFWGLFVGELSPYILMLFSISIGLVVDDSVHILSKYISALKNGETPARAVSYSLDKAGSAITITTLSLAVGTFVLVLSNTFHFQNVALLLTPIIVVAWLLDLYFLPPLLLRFDRWRQDQNTTPATTDQHA